VLERAELFHCTVAPERKPVPFTVSVKVPPAAVAEFGVRLVRAGVGALMGKLTAFEAVPPGLVTLTVALPVAAIRLAGTEAVNCVPLTKVVVRAKPLHSTVAPERNPVPFTASVKETPVAVAELGFRLVMAGTSGLIVKLTALEIAPPGFFTVTLALPEAAIRLAATDAVSCVALRKVVGSGEPFH